MKRFHLTHFAILVLSLTLVISCTEKKAQKKAPAKEIKVKPNTEKIDSLATEAKVVAAQKVVKKQATYKNPYHIIIGSYVEKENAVLLMKKYKEKGFDTYLIARPDGEHISVSIASYPDIHQAYNELYNIQDEKGIEAWVLFQENK